MGANTINIHSQNRISSSLKIENSPPRKEMIVFPPSIFRGELLNFRGVESCCLSLHIYCHPSKFHVRRWNVIPLAHRHDYVIYGACISSFTKASNLPFAKIERASCLYSLGDFPRVSEILSIWYWQSSCIHDSFVYIQQWICTNLTGC